MSVSVAMATYNGSAYLAEQVDSILAQLGDDDELVVVDDASTDDTVGLLESYADPRLVVIRSATNNGYVRAFERALGLTRGDVVLLADQDDVWMPDRLRRLREALRDGGVAASNLLVLGTDEPLTSPVTGRPWLLTANSSTGSSSNIRRLLMGDIPYFGCTMALRRESLEQILPFPPFLTESHDLWIAIVANVFGEMVHVEEPTLWRRVHESNASSPKPRGVRAALRSRVMLMRAVGEARRRRKRSVPGAPAATV